MRRQLCDWTAVEILSEFMLLLMKVFVLRAADGPRVENSKSLLPPRPPKPPRLLTDASQRPQIDGGSARRRHRRAPRGNERRPFKWSVP